MKKLMTSAAVLALGASSAVAGGLDRSGQNISIIFQDGTYAEFAIGRVTPELTGTNSFVAGADYDDVAGDYFQSSGGFKTDINEKLSFALFFDQPYGADVLYGASTDLGAAVTMIETDLENTSARVDSYAMNAYLRYKFNENFSVHGGLRLETAKGEITLGDSYGAAAGYNVQLGADTALGYSAGVAYERKDIALRVVLTYHSAITHDFSSTETFAISPDPMVPAGFPLPGETSVDTPEAFNLDFQTGIAENTLLFGGVRYALWGDFDVIPQFLGSDLADLGDSTTYRLGVARRFSDTFAASVSFTYEEEGDPLVSPLAPSNGQLGVSIGGQYTMDNLVLSAGINYTDIGDANPQLSDTAFADFTDNSAFGWGLKIGYTF